MFTTTSTNVASFGKTEAFITFKRGRKKIYSNKFIYLNDQDEFEIELFNGLQENVLVKISFANKINPNDKGLLLYPGQRVFLDRFLNESSKFKFSTYKIENSKDAKYAIAHNGEIKIDFYTIAPNWNTSTIWTNNVYYNSIPSINLPNFNLLNNSGTFNIGTTGSATYSANTTTTNSTNDHNSTETGKIDKGAISNQKLTDVNDNSIWNYYPTKTYEYKILPVSQKPDEVKNMKTFCTECGIGLRSEFKYCPKCGKKC